MGYRPRKNYTVTAQPTGRTVDGVATYCAAASFASVSGVQDSASIGSTMTRLLVARGGATRSNSTNVPIPYTLTPTSTTGRFDGFAFQVSSTRVVRNVAGTGWTGTGNVLSDAVVILEFLQ